ncbi:MAG: TlpA family protein disulfide reductase, partial [Actinobacteria bacterium]|nr:TlpA family protein disulfide reductase [Actinomycetota bacterium]
YGIPETFVIDKYGVIAVKITGIATSASLDAAIQTARMSTGTP